MKNETSLEITFMLSIILLRHSFIFKKYIKKKTFITFGFFNPNMFINKYKVGGPQIFKNFIVFKTCYILYNRSFFLDNSHAQRIFKIKPFVICLNTIKKNQMFNFSEKSFEILVKKLHIKQRSQILFIWFLFFGRIGFISGDISFLFLAQQGKVKQDAFFYQMPFEFKIKKDQLIISNSSIFLQEQFFFFFDFADYFGSIYRFKDILRKTNLKIYISSKCKDKKKVRELINQINVFYFHFIPKQSSW